MTRRLDSEHHMTYHSRNFVSNESQTVTDSAMIYRILDAAANRACEGMRVVEDYVRFGLNDAFLSQTLKECRHQLTATLSIVPETKRLATRDTLGDVGVTIGLPSEYRRDSSLDVVRASFKRVQEALRSLEEYGKLVPTGSPSFAKSFEQLRYRLYTVEKSVLRAAASPRDLFEQRLYLIVTAASCAAGYEVVVRGALAAGVNIVQLREKRMTDRDLVTYARQIRSWTREAGALLIINDRADIAVLSEADGVHIGQEELTVSDARRIIGPDRLVGVSTHDMTQARQAVLDGADYLGVGPTFPSPTKAFNAFTGLEFIRQVGAEMTLPWFAVGGIASENVADILAAGAGRIAVSSAILAAGDPHRATSELLATMTTGNLSTKAT